MSTWTSVITGDIHINLDHNWYRVMDPDMTLSLDVTMALGGSEGHSNQHDSCTPIYLRFVLGSSHLYGLWCQHGPQMSTQTPTGVGPWAQIWPLAAAQAWMSPRPWVTSRPHTSACILPHFLLQFSIAHKPLLVHISPPCLLIILAPT